MSEPSVLPKNQKQGLFESISLGCILLIYLLISQIHQSTGMFWLPLAAPSLLLLCLGYHWIFNTSVKLFCNHGYMAKAEGFIVRLAPYAAIGLFFTVPMLTVPKDFFTLGIRLKDTASLSLVIAVVIAPVAEEFFFRGLLLEHFRRHFGAFFGIALSSLLFALLHLPKTGPIFALFLFATSIIFCCMVLYGKGLASVMTLHIFWNCFVFGTLFSYDKLLLCFATFITVVIFSLLRRKHLRHAKPTQQKPAAEIS